MSRSAYRAHVTKENCVACGRCVEYCPTGAAKLGQKLCTKNGEITYPKQELPDATKWGPEKWSKDYRDKNQINCYETGTAPCKTACPAHVPVQGYVKMAAEGRYMDALKLIKNENPFPAVCGSICNRRCEDACTRGTIDEPIAIDAVKRFIAERDLHADTRYEKEYGQLYADIMLELSQGTLAPVRSAGTNGKKPALPVAFWEYVKEPDYGDVSEKLDFKLHPLLHTTYYRKQLRIQILKNVYN